MTAQTDASLEIAQRKVRAVLILGQIMAGLGMGATLSMGAILAGRIGGSDALSGMAATMATLGAALAAVPLASLASRAGRALSLASGASVAALGGLVVIGAIVVSSFILLLVGLMMVGV
ncbi:MAG: MFS transporter, partial [Microbacteriaceae bacterium]|nr:MFS transporter [Microbacteriaceae bacterium]